MNIFMYIIWNNAYTFKERIISDLSSSFNVIKTIEIEWSEDKFSENLTRFYGQKLPKNSFKEKAVGIGPFTLVVLEDETPVYETRHTTSGDEVVNIHTFEKKMLYRQLTNLPSGNNCVHGTNTIKETDHDMTLLLGEASEDFINHYEGYPSTLKEDVVGSRGWDSLEKLFYVLNHTSNYAVLRNYEGLPDNYYLDGHNDIDFLVDRYDEFRGICNAREVFRRKNRVQCMCTVAGKDVQIDIRHCGDGYYDTNWEQDILNNRMLKNGVYVPCELDYKYSLLYHALIHKRTIAEDYKDVLDSEFGRNNWDIDVLNTYLEEKQYSITEPYDLSVFFNEKNSGRRMTGLRKFRVFLRWIRRRFLNDNS